MNQRFMLQRVAAFVCLACAELARAQSGAPIPPTSGDALRQARPEAPAPVAAPALPDIGGTPHAPAPLQTLPGSGATVRVASFEISGNKVVDSATLAGLLHADAQKAYSLQDLEAFAATLTRYYRARGYFVARAYVPAQDLTDGKLALRVIEGNYGRFHLTNSSRVRDDIVQGLLDDIKDRDIVSLDTLERAMLIINDTPGAKVVRADVMPGEAVGTSDFTVETVATPGVGGFVLVDNHGSRYTGKNRASFDIDWNSPTGRGDRLSASGMTTGRGLQSGHLDYSMLAASNGTRASIGLGRTHYKLGDRYAALDATGTADRLDLGLTTPFKRTRNASIELGAGAATTRLRDEVAFTATSTKKRSETLEVHALATIEDRWLGIAGLTSARAGLTFGSLHFGDAVAAAQDDAGARTRGQFVKANLDFTRISLLSQRVTLTAQVRAQQVLNGRNLDGSEKMEVTGANAVAAYTQGELSGDNAARVRLELGRSLPVVAGVACTVSAAANWGHAAVASSYANARSRSVADLELGLSGNHPSGVLFKAVVARRTSGGEPISEPVSRTRLLVQAGWVL